MTFALFACVLLAVGACHGTAIHATKAENTRLPESSASQAHVTVWRSNPVLVNSCVVTSHLKLLVEFYRHVLTLEPRTLTPEYAEFATGAGVVALFSAKAQEAYIPGSAKAEQNRSIILEFRVTNVDHEYQRLHGFVKNWVKGPTTQPWGTRSIYFRDPDGNLIDFWTVCQRSSAR